MLKKKNPLSRSLRILFIVLFIGLALGSTACSSGGNSDNTSATGSAL